MQQRRQVEGQRHSSPRRPGARLLLRSCLDGAGGSEPDRVRERVPGYGTATAEAEPYLPDCHAFARTVIGWSFSPKGYAATAESPIPPEIELPLPDYGETLRPGFAGREADPGDTLSRKMAIRRSGTRPACILLGTIVSVHPDSGRWRHMSRVLAAACG